MTLNLTDPAFLFPGISLLFLAYTNRYLALANIIRALNSSGDDHEHQNRASQIKSLHLRITLIKYMQALGVLAFLLCVSTMLLLLVDYPRSARFLFLLSLAFMVVSLILSFIEIMKSGESLKLELERNA